MAPGALRALCLLLPLLLPLQVVSQGDFELSDALGDGKAPVTLKPKAPAAPGGAAAGGAAAGGAATGGDFTLEDLFNLDDAASTTKAPKLVPKVPAVTRAPAKPKPAADDLDLADALDPSNDLSGRDGRKGQGGRISDKDLTEAIDEGYKPDKGKGGRPGADDKINQHDDSGETTAEIGTIAGIVSAVAMAIVGAISSYISYQKKKLCFSLQQSLNTDMVKAENPEAVVATEPQVQQTLLEPPNAEPPTEENAV